MTLCRNASFPEFAWSGRVSSMTNRSEATAPRDPQRSHPSQGAVGHGSVTPGLALAFSAALLALGGQRLVPTVSPLLVSIVLGMVVTNVWPIPARFGPGMTVAGKRVLRLGIVLLGLQLAVRDILGLGWQMMLVVVAIVGLGIVGTVWIGVLLGVSPAQRLLIACGFSVCGAAAVAAVEGVTDADQEDVASAISLVVVFGTAMIGIVPTVLGFSDLTLVQQGMIAGGAIHEVAQVVAASGLIGTGALAAAIVIKLARVLMLAPGELRLMYTGSSHEREQSLSVLFPTAHYNPMEVGGAGADSAARHAAQVLCKRRHEVLRQVEVGSLDELSAS